MLKGFTPMEIALSAAKSVRYSVKPNPWVGAVIVEDGAMSHPESWIVGSTEPVGGNHAEIVALKRAGNRAKKSTMYVTLEPCSHTGKTGPCVQAIVDAGVKKVVVSIKDPDKKVNGKGIKFLREHGVQVEIGDEARKTKALLDTYIHHRATGKPYVILKFGASIDGKIAAIDGSSKWITGTEARFDAHVLRAASDAVVVGSHTVEIDDPSLDARLGEFNPLAKVEGIVQPEKIVVGKIPSKSKLSGARSYVGDLKDLVTELGDKGALQILVEGGADIAKQFHEAKLVDKYVFYFAPKIVGGEGLSMFSDHGTSNIGDVWTGKFVNYKKLGNDIKIELTKK